MRITTFQTVASKLAATMGRERGVQVTYGGTGAWATPNGHIHLPALPAGTVLTSYQADLMRGYLDHEVGHVRWTDWGTLIAGQDEFTAKPALKDLWNITEDVWQENKTLDEYPGSARFLNTTHGFMDGEGVKILKDRAASGEPITQADLGRRLIYRELWRHRGIERDVGSDLELKDIDLQEAAEVIASDFPDCESSDDCLELARKLYAILHDSVENFEPPPPEQGEGEGDDASEDGDEEGKGSGGGGEAGDEESDEEGSGGAGGDEDGEGKGRAKSGKGSRAQGPTEPGDADDCPSAASEEHQDLLSKILGDIMDKNSTDENRKGKTRPVLKTEREDPDPSNPGEFVTMEWVGDDYLPPAGTDGDRIFVESGSNKPAYEHARAAMAGQISSIKKALAIYLRSKEMKAWSRGLDEGQLDGDRLADFCATGEKRIYKERRTRSFPNTAFMIMGDLSTSMNASMVRVAMIAFAEALAQLPRIKTGIAGFLTNDHEYTPTAGSGRCEGVDIVLYKGFDEPYRTVHGRLGAIGTGGCTPLGDGYGYAFEALVKRPEPRKVLLMLTDGEPYYTWSGRGGNLTMRQKLPSHNDYALMRHVHQKCQTFGVETLGIGMPAGMGCGGDGEALKEYVDRFEMIRNQDQLAPAILEMTKRVVVPS